MDDGMKQLRVRFSGLGQDDQAGSQTVTKPAQQGSVFGRGQMSDGGEHDAAYAATVAAVAYAIAAREEKAITEKFAFQKKAITEKLASPKKPTIEKLASRKKSTTIHQPAAASSPKSATEGSKILRWFSGKEPIEDDDEDEPGANVSVRRPLKQVQKKPEGSTSGHEVIDKVVDSVPSIKKDPSFTRKAEEKKGSRKFEQDQAIQKATPESRPTTTFRRDRRESWKFEQEHANPRAPQTPRATSTAVSSEAETMGATWEKEKLAKIKKQYNETMETIAQWEAEKKAKARHQKEPKEGDSEKKRAKVLEEYNDEMKRISKVAAASRLAAEEKRRCAEGRVREKAAKIRSTGKLPQSCGCF